MICDYRGRAVEKESRRENRGTALKYNKKKGKFVERQDRILGLWDLGTEYMWMVGITGVGSISEYKPVCKGLR